MKRVTAWALCLLLLACGCTSQAEKTMGGGEVFYYPELETFEQEGLFSVAYPAAKGNWVEAKKSAKSNAFSAAVSKFEAAPLPSGHDNRKAAKDQAITAAKSLHDKAVANAPNPELEAAYKSLSGALKDLRGG